LNIFLTEKKQIVINDKL